MDLSNGRTKVQFEVVYDDYEALTVAFSLDDGLWHIMIIEHEDD